MEKMEQNEIKKSEVLIANPEKLQEKIEKFREGGAEKMHILSDFDRTLTKAFVGTEKVPTIIAEIRNGNYLTPDYTPRAHALFDKYHPIEINTSINRIEKEKAMHEWWKKHFDLLVECGLNKEVMQDIVTKKTIQFRIGAKDFLTELKNKDIPVVIMSAAIGDMVLMYLEQEGLFFDNIYMIANLFEFDENGKVTKIKEPIIHSLNKAEIALKEFPIFEKIANRKNVFLLGDGIDDIGMVEGFDYDEIIKIGFLNEEIEKNKKIYLENFDVVITNDGNMRYVNGLLEQILGDI